MGITRKTRLERIQAIRVLSGGNAGLKQALIRAEQHLKYGHRARSDEQLRLALTEVRNVRALDAVAA